MYSIKSEVAWLPHIQNDKYTLISAGQPGVETPEFIYQLGVTSNPVDALMFVGGSRYGVCVNQATVLQLNSDINRRAPYTIGIAK
jgi:hypothetical protein